MNKLCHSMMMVAAGFHIAVAQLNVGPGSPPGKNYFWPRYDYTNKDIHYSMELALANNYVCKWETTMPGMNMAQSLLVLPPCVYITPHWHPDTYELNFVMQGKLSYWVYPYTAVGKPGITLSGVVPQGDALISPLGLQHLLLNDQCDPVVLIHSFPSSTNSDFFDSLANIQGMPGDYLESVGLTPNGQSNLTLNKPDGTHTVSQACLARCAIGQEYYQNWQCPKDIPLKPIMIDPSVFQANPMPAPASAPVPAPAPAPATVGKCTYGDTPCSGNQCCPPAPETGGKSYPCPTADVGWNSCGTSASLSQKIAKKRKVQKHVRGQAGGDDTDDAAMLQLSMDAEEAEDAEELVDVQEL